MPKQVLDRLVNAELLAQAGGAPRHRPVGRGAAEDHPRNTDFQKEGAFDFARYQQVLRDFYRQTPQEYEEELRRQLAAQKMLEVVRTGAVVSDDEVRARYEKEGNQAKLVFARFLPTMFADKVARAHRRAAGGVPEGAREGDRRLLRGQQLRVQQPERIHARQILVKVAPDATPEQKAAGEGEGRGAAQGDRRRQGLRRGGEGEQRRRRHQGQGRRAGLGGARHLGPGAGRTRRSRSTAGK